MAMRGRLSIRNAALIGLATLGFVMGSGFAAPTGPSHSYDSYHVRYVQHVIWTADINPNIDPNGLAGAEKFCQNSAAQYAAHHTTFTTDAKVINGVQYVHFVCIDHFAL